MIVTKLFCGLGNQMFQYAAGLALAHQRNATGVSGGRKKLDKLKLSPYYFIK
jgi:hypothetical protein